MPGYDASKKVRKNDPHSSSKLPFEGDGHVVEYQPSLDDGIQYIQIYTRTPALALFYSLSLFLRFGIGKTQSPAFLTFSSLVLVLYSIKAAINKPKTPSFPLIECEFPPLAALNKLGDGSRSSSNQVDDVRIDIKLYVYKNTYVSWREVSGSSKMRPG